jgi:hypothetical protein
MNQASVSQQSRWLAAIFVAACLGLGLLLCQLEYNPSHGASIDFNRYHYATIEQFRQLSFAQFLQEMKTASGPLYYALMGASNLGPLAVRMATVALHVASTGLVLVLALRSLPGSVWPWLLASTFYVSPFQLGPALWGHPETLATLMILAALWLQGRGFGKLSSVLAALSVSSRQTAVAILAALGLFDLTRGRWAALAVKALVAGLALLYLILSWHALTPPLFKEHQSANSRTLLVSIALMAIALLTWEIDNPVKGWRHVIKNWLVAAPLCLLVYNLSGPFDRGGYVFSILDHVDAKHLPISVTSPLLLSAVLAVYLSALRKDLTLAAAIVGMSATLAVSNVFYVKYIDFYVWPIALALFVEQAGDPQRLRSVTRSLALWSVSNLLFVSLRY